MWRKKSIFRHLAMVTQLGFCVLASIFLCVFVGYSIDSRFETNTLIVFLILGTLAGGRSAYVLIQKMIQTEAKEDEQERQKNRSMAISPSVSKPKPVSHIRRGSTPDTEKAGKEDFHE